MDRLNTILNFLIGNSKTESMEERLFNTLTLLNGVVNLVGVFQFLDQEHAKLLVVQQLLAGFIMLVLYGLSRVYFSYRTLLLPFVFTMQVFVIAHSISNAGTFGGAHYYAIPSLVISVILSQKMKWIILVTLSSTVSLLFLFWVELHNPDWIASYSSHEIRSDDVYPNLLFATLLTGFMVIVLARSLNQEREKSDGLLLNILPREVADELKEEDRVSPKKYESATVLFTDFVGFTKLSETLSPNELIAELDGCFRAFDHICKKHGVEKIKTIGDAYMAVAGVPKPYANHATSALLAALEIRDYMNDEVNKRESVGKSIWNIRIGIHSGPLVAGVIGHHKFAYDVWGDTVNTASRMESSGEIGQINISQSTYCAVKDQFVCEHRGKVSAKNKGELDMYRVISPIGEIELRSHPSRIR